MLIWNRKRFKQIKWKEERDFHKGPFSTCAHNNAVSFGLFLGCWENRKRRRKKVEEKLTGLWSLIVGGGVLDENSKGGESGMGSRAVTCGVWKRSCGDLFHYFDSWVLPPCTNTMPLFINSFLWLDLPVFFLPFFLYFSFSSHLPFWLHASFEFELPEGITFHLKTWDVTKHIVWMLGNCLQVWTLVIAFGSWDTTSWITPIIFSCIVLLHSQSYNIT